MNTVTKVAITSVALGTLIFGGVGTALAAEQDGERKYKKGFRGYKIVPHEIRADIRADVQNLSNEEKEALREEMKADREERKAAFEEFVGLSREEVKERKQDGETMGDILSDQGKTKSDTETFLTEQANIHVDNIAERHNLSTEDETTIRDRISTFVSKVLDRWFGS